MRTHHLLAVACVAVRVAQVRATCNDWCGPPHASNGACEDGGGPNAVSAACPIGMDCTDCGPRAAPEPSPPHPAAPPTAPFACAFSTFADFHAAFPTYARCLDGANRDMAGDAAPSCSEATTAEHFTHFCACSLEAYTEAVGLGNQVWQPGAPFPFERSGFCAGRVWKSWMLDGTAHV